MANHNRDESARAAGAGALGESENMLENKVHSEVVPGRDAHEADGVTGRDTGSLADDQASQPIDVGAQVRDLESTVASMTTERESLEALLTQSERRRQIEGLLRDADAIDVGAALLLTEAAIAKMDTDEIDLASVVDELVRTKSYLFEHEHGGGSWAGQNGHLSVMSGVVGGGERELHEAAMTARQTGDRHALLRYMRMRNGM